MATDNDYELIEAPATDDDYTTDPLEMAKSAGATDSNVSLDDLESILNAKKGNIRQAERDIEEQNRLNANEGIKAAARGGVQGLTLGYSDEAIGALNSALGDETYAQARDKQRALNAEAEAKHPLAYGGAKLAGNVATGALTGAASIPALAGLGAVQGLGESEADLTKGDVKGALRDTAVGGVAGAAAGAVGQGLAKAIPAVGRGLSRGAEYLGEKALGINGSQAAKLATRNPGAVREALDRGAVKLWGTSESNLARVKGIDQDVGRELGNIIDQLDQKGGKVQVADLAQALQTRVDELSQVPGTVNKTLINQLNREIKELGKAPVSEIPLSMLEENMKRGFQAKSNYNPVSDTGAVRKQGTKDIAKIYQDTAQDVANATDPALGRDFAAAKSTIGNMKGIQQAAAKKTVGDQIVDKIFNQGTGALSGGAGGGYTAYKQSKGNLKKTAAGAVGGALAGAALARVPSASAVVVDALSSALQKAPNIFGRHSKSLMAAAQRGATSLAATSYALANRDPEYKKLLEQIMNTKPENVGE